MCSLRISYEYASEYAAEQCSINEIVKNDEQNSLSNNDRHFNDRDLLT